MLYFPFIIFLSLNYFPAFIHLYCSLVASLKCDVCQPHFFLKNFNGFPKYHNTSHEFDQVFRKTEFSGVALEYHLKFVFVKNVTF